MHENTSARLRLLILTSTLPRWEGDTEPRFVLDLAKFMLNRFDPVILAPSAPGAAIEEEICGVKVKRFRYAPLRRWETLAAPGAIINNIRSRPWLLFLIPGFFLCQTYAIARSIKNHHYDAIHCHWIFTQGLSLRLLSIFFETPPWLLTIHGADAYTLNWWPLRFLKKWVIDGAPAATVVSHEITTFLRVKVLPGVEKRFQKISMGVDLSIFSNSSLCTMPRVPNEILFVGRLAEKKGLHVLIRALTCNRLRDLGARLVVIGDGPDRNLLEDMAVRHGVEGIIRFEGSKSHDLIALGLATASVFCAPFVVDSVGDREGMPSVLLEAAAAGTPIVASNVGGVSALVEPGRSGWLVPPGDSQALANSLIEALTDRRSSSLFAQEARRRVESYSWPAIAELYGNQIAEIAHAG